MKLEIELRWNEITLEKNKSKKEVEKRGNGSPLVESHELKIASPSRRRRTQILLGEISPCFAWVRKHIYLLLFPLAQKILSYVTSLSYVNDDINDRIDISQ